MTFSQWLVANGYDEAQLNDGMRRHLELAWKAEEETKKPKPPVTPVAIVTNPPTPGAGFNSEIEAIRRENQRVEQIQNETKAACRNAVNDKNKIDALEQIGRDAIAQNWSIEQFQLKMVREERVVGPMIFVPRAPEITSQVIEASVCKAGGLQTLEKEYNAQTLEVAHTRFKGGIGLLEMVGMCAERNGWTGGNVKRDLRGALRMAFREGGDGGMRADVGPSTISISGILSNIANKFVREAFMFVEDTRRQISAVRPVSDFKQITTYSLTGDLTYEKVAPGGEIKHGTLGEETYTNQADTYAKLLGLDRRDLINDDMGALSSAGRRLGRGGALKVNDVFWTVFLANSAFFTAGRGNYDDGASDTLMDLTGIANANTLFMMMNDPDGKPTGTIPAIALVPPQLYPQAYTLLVSKQLNLATSTAAATGTDSPWAGMFKLLQSRYLANSSFPGYSTKAWYLLADPNDLPVIETVYLNGAEMPTIETADMDLDRLGIAMRGYHDFGCELQEYRAGTKMKGEA